MTCMYLIELACAGWCSEGKELRPLGLEDAAVCVNGGSCPTKNPHVCPWGHRGTLDCAEFGPPNCPGDRCGLPLPEACESGRVYGAIAE